MNGATETTIEAVAPGGRTKLPHRTTRFRTDTRIAGRLVDRFDSNSPEDVVAANADPERRKLIQELRQSVVIHQEPTGEIRRYESPGGPDPRLEVAHDPRQRLPAVAPSRPARHVGRRHGDPACRLVVLSKTILSSVVRQHEGELTALLDSRKTVALEPDQESGSKVRLVSGDGMTPYELSVDRCRVR